MNRIFALLFFLWGLSLYGQVKLRGTLVEDKHRVACSDYSREGTYFFTGGTDKIINVRDAKVGTVIKRFSGMNKIPLSLDISSDLKFLISGGKDSVVSVWDFDSGEKLRSMKGHSGYVTTVAISPDDRKIVSGGQDAAIFIWSLSNGEKKHLPDQHGGAIQVVDFHPDGEMFISGCNEGVITLWETATGRLINSFKACKGSVNDIAFSPDGNFFATGGADNSIKIWNAYNQSLQNTILVHEEAVKSIDFSPDGKYIISGGMDRYVVMTKVNSGKMIFNSEEQSNSISNVAFNPDGQTFVSSSLHSDTLWFWSASELNIKPFFANEQNKELLKPKPEIEWVTANNQESNTTGYRLRFKIFSELPVDYMNLYLNGEIHKRETDLSLEPGQWEFLDNLVYLENDTNEIKIELLYSGGIVASEVRNITFVPTDLASISAPARSSGARKITVMLRENDEYEYTVRGAEGYSFHSEVINTMELQGKDIEVDLVPLKKETSIRLDNIHFATNSANLTSDSFDELDRVVDLIDTNPGIIIEISAHTCNLGADAYNMLLSERRAESVVDYLLDHNIPEDCLVSKGYGMHKPAVPNTSEENRALNRRVEFKVVQIEESEKSELSE